jgi:antitoxin (DNA-binding transcriptional repressor) of toxin-antitoxin stability system
VRRLDAYGDLALDLEKTHLAGFARELRSAPDAQGYIVVYGGRCSAGSQALERAERAKEWLISKHGIDASRIVAIDGGYRETLRTEIYIGAIDATWPELESSIQPLDQSRCK